MLLSTSFNDSIECFIECYFKFLGFLARYRGRTDGVAGLRDVSQTEMRAWMADARRRGLGARSLARALSAVKTFFRWLGERDGFEPTAVLAARSPKYRDEVASIVRNFVVEAHSPALDVLDRAFGGWDERVAVRLLTVNS